ncbi:GDP-mannose 4,6-dehydratase [Patescibacteria group bacterium]|nr:GDP-mannose 4,6-dehydratase [Patescibacteria group bacterium]MCL5797994.1 GDP-mannose 4,6-dehydratase [Patescibacteria group bacterium]
MKTKLLITGGAGFIGSNLSARFLKKGFDVTIFDNFERLGTRENAKWLKSEYPNMNIITGDIRKYKELEKAVKGKDIIFHLAAQVAVTTSVLDPRTDFDINAFGTFNLLEATRTTKSKPLIIFTSTNKVYGEMEDVVIKEKKDTYAYRDYPEGISEKMNLDFHSPYGCSKGAADQYIRDYGRIYGIPTVVFRQSCIYGPRQFGIEDQGWIAWFIIATVLGKKITIYGDGKQVRDVLYIDDLVRLFEIAVSKKKKVAGKIYNVGGGKDNILSVWSQFGPILERLFGKTLTPAFADWRPGDQKVYVSDIRFVGKDLGWKPEIKVEKGIEKLYAWVMENKKLFEIFR